MFTVYKAYGTRTKTSYYGYCENSTPYDAFKKQARSYDDRFGVDGKFLEDNGGIGNIVFVTLTSYEDELEAWMSRNDYRSIDSESVSRPSHFPVVLHEKANEEHPGRVEQWKINVAIHSCVTAREAYVKGKWTFDQIKKICNLFPKKEVAKDLDTLTPADFALKYNP